MVELPFSSELLKRDAAGLKPVAPGRRGEVELRFPGRRRVYVYAGNQAGFCPVFGSLGGHKGNHACPCADVKRRPAGRGDGHNGAEEHGVGTDLEGGVGVADSEALEPK